MKRLYNTFKNAGRRVSATAFVLVATLLCTSGAWAADYGFFDTNDQYVWYVQIGYNGTNYGQHGDRSTNYSGDAELGVVTTDIYLDGYYGWCWGGNNNNRYLRMYSALKYNDGNFTSFSEEYSQEWTAQGDQQIQTASFSGTKKLYTYSSLAAGNYQYKYYLQVTGTGTAENNYCSNNGNNMWVKFTIPGFINNPSSANLSTAPETYTDKTITFNHYGTALTTSNCSITGTGRSNFSVQSINESGVTVRFTAPSTEGAYTATLTITDANSKVATITLNGLSNFPTTVSIADEPVVSAGPQVELSGYLKYSGCDKALMKRGFFYCQGNPCDVTTGSNKVEIDGETSLKAKETFSKKFFKSDAGTALIANTTYCYKAYVYSTAGGYTLSSETGKFTTGSACTFAVGDTVYYTVDNTQAEDPCELRFSSLANAIADMKQTTTGHAAWINGSSYVQKPIVVEVVKGSTAYGNANNKTRDNSMKSLNGYSASYSAPSSTPTNRLIVRAKDPKNKPTFKGGFDMTQARYITLKDLIITYSDNTGSSHAYSAIELGYCDEGTMNSVAPGVFSDSDIEILGCEIDATAFNCLHAVGCDGLVFDDCTFNLEGTGAADNDKYWGASVKLASCKNVQFTRNSLKGSHATSLFLQYAQNTLVMNNVFWNDNLFTSNVAFVRPVVINDGNTQHNLENVGIYYNTFYLADHAASAYNVDFLRFGCTSVAKQTGQTSYYKADKIHFKWNNCYSYDDKISARNDNATAFQSVTLPGSNYDSNNFWSKGDASPDNEATSSNLGFGTNTHHINVEEQVCKSTATDPDELILKGSLLNIGNKPTTDISGLGVANSTFADRFNNTIRSEGNDWTYGAFQQANIVEVDTIIWAGGKSGAWDVRSNWVTTTGKRLNCANMFAANLHVIIPDAEGVDNIPVIPVWSDAATRGAYSEEYVAASLGAKSFANVSKFASSMTIEEGGAIKGIENLYGDGTLRYNGANNSFTARRSEWVLVGGVIKPFENGESGSIRNVQSGDFYIADHKPHVYMQHYAIDGSTIKPSIPFTSLETEVATNSAFGILIPDQYGQFKLPASSYFKYFEPNEAMVGDATVPKQFKFKGRFADEAARPTYTISATGLANCVFVNNSYTANLNVAKLLYDNSAKGLQAKVYRYDIKSWDDVTASNTDAGADYVKPNNGFVLYATSGTGSIQTTAAQYGSGSTVYYKGVQADTNLRLRVINSADATASNLNIIYEGTSLPKAFSYNESTPEIYVPDGSDMFSTYSIDDMAKVIPLSVRNKQASGSITIQFKLMLSEGFESVILEDRLLGKTYDLLDGEAPFFSGIAPGDCAGRFYLNINYAEEGTTNVEEEANDSITGAGSIDIYRVNGNQVVISSADNVTLSQAYVTDLSGRTVVVNLLDSHYNVITLDSAQGVFIIKAVGDSASKTEKVIVK